MPKYYRVRFYSDIVRCDDTKPCEVHARAYPSQMEAEKAANGAMALMRGRFGAAAGYLVAIETVKPWPSGRSHRHLSFHRAA